LVDILTLKLLLMLVLFPGYLLHQRVDAGISSVRLETIIDDKRRFVHVQFIAHVDVGVGRLLAHFFLLQLRVGSVAAQFGISRYLTIVLHLY